MGLSIKMERPLTPFQYSNAYAFSNGRAAVAKELNRKWGFINEKGEEIIPLIYSRVFSFEQGFAIVQLADKWGALDIDGNIVVPIDHPTADKARLALKRYRGIDE
jgi:hypothetical protein